MRLFNMISKTAETESAVDFTTEVNKLNGRVEELEREIKRFEIILGDLKGEYVKQVAQVIANETFITRLSEDMFMTVAKREFRKKWN